MPCAACIYFSGAVAACAGMHQTLHVCASLLKKKINQHIIDLCCLYLFQWSCCGLRGRAERCTFARTAALRAAAAAAAAAPAMSTEDLVVSAHSQFVILSFNSVCIHDPNT